MKYNGYYDKAKNKRKPIFKWKQKQNQNFVSIDAMVPQSQCKN